jgi:FkbM family methyltransferase
VRLDPRKFWSVQFALRRREQMTFGSMLRYRSRLLREFRGRTKPDESIRLRMKPPYSGELWLRGADADEATFEEVFTRQVYRSVADRIADAEFVIDLGANIGLATRYLAGRLPRCRIFAIEPDPQNFAMLRLNVGALAAAERCRSMRAALWDKEAELFLTPPPNGDRYNSIRVLERCDGLGASVRGMTMSEIFKASGFPRIDLLKVDVEGAEAALFSGGLEWLRRTRVIAIEFHDDARRASDFDAVMAEHGFEVDNSDAHTVVAWRAGKEVIG